MRWTADIRWATATGMPKAAKMKRIDAQNVDSIGCVGIIPATDAGCMTVILATPSAAAIAVDAIPAPMAKRE